MLAAIEAHGLTPANINAPGQIVAAGTRAQLGAFAADPPARRPAAAAVGGGRFPHRAHGSGGRRAAGAAAGVTVSDPAIPLLSNRDGAAVTSGADWLERIVTQVGTPVRWDQCMRDHGRPRRPAPSSSCRPAGTLTGIARRALPGVATLALKTPDDLDRARSLFAEHGAPDPLDHVHCPSWRLLVAAVRRDRPARRRPSAVPAPGVAVTAGGPSSGTLRPATGQHASRPAAAARSSSGWSRTATRWAWASPGPAAAGGSRVKPAVTPTERPGTADATDRAPARARARILAFGGYQPDRVVTNDDLAETMDTNDEWIRSRVGIISRRIAGPDETVADMAVAAAGKALAGSGVAPPTSTWSSWRPAPPRRRSRTWPPGGARLGINAPGAYDLNAACAGFCYGLANASDAVRAAAPGRAGHRRGEDVASGWTGRTARPASSSPTARARPWSGQSAIQGRAGHRPGGVGQRRRNGGQDRRSRTGTRSSFQEGQAVFRWATTALHPVALEACEKAGVDAGRAGGVRPAPGQPAHHRGARPQDRGAAGAGRRRHRARRQHLVGVDPAGPVPDDRAR